MDKVKHFFKLLRTHHFWLLSLVIVILSLFAWFRASGALTAQFQKNRNEVTSRFDALNRITSQPAANDKIIQDVEQQTQTQRERVRKVWEELYGNQKEKILFWPPQLGDDFLRRINQLPFGAEIPQNLREDYRDYVRERFKELPRIVKASPESISRATGAGGRQAMAVVAGSRPAMADAEGNGGAAAAGDYLVDWNDYGEIELKLVWDQLPASLKVWVTQEDLWVYETLLNVIAKTNEGATGNHDAAIKQIVRLQVGRDAALESASTGRITRMQAGAGSEEPRGPQAMPGAGEGDPMRAGEPGRAGSGTADAEAEAKYLAQYRYLGDDGKPIADAAAAGSAGLEFKRLPVRMELIMDQRKLPLLLVECANATLPVEVEQVRINATAGAGGLGRDVVRTVMPRRDEGVGVGSSFARPGMMGEGGVAGAADPAIVPVTIHGIIYIYMPPNLEALGISESGPAVADGTVTQPAA
jgi:hypothetical protein